MLLYPSIRSITCHSAATRRFSSIATCLTSQSSSHNSSTKGAKLPSLRPAHNVNADFKGRKEALLASEREMYPVISDEPLYQRISDIRIKYDHMSAEELAALDVHLHTGVGGRKLTVRGRIMTIRAQGSRLLFLDIAQEECKIQAIYRLNSIPAMDDERFRKSWEWLRRGDFVSVTGIVSRTRTGELSVRATSEIKLLSPCLHPIPLTLSSEQTRSHNRTVNLLVHSAARDILRARAFVLTYLRTFFSARDFLEVQTPILSDVAGGAAARPFVTHATVLGAGPDSLSLLELRIAPELWLKRLIISGFDRVFEIGQVFRNEGVDATHNPEFTTCEFYQAFASLDDLISLTEELLSGLVKSAVEKVPAIKTNIHAKGFKFDAPFLRVDFISTLEECMGMTFPDFVLNSSEDSEDAKQFLKRLFAVEGIPIPNPGTVARMLDKLCDYYIGPILGSAKTPVILMNFPEVLSPLAKSAKADGKDYRIARRFELYVDGKELVNAYEEENSPFVQRRKFELQLRDREVDVEAHATDEGYLASMEWGLPPTGGWGIGIDRLVMLLTGAERISDVLTFGGIKGVVGQE
ncbi:hypothetical protein V1522DRAFT_399317 [Lipomyces starkeyi]